MRLSLNGELAIGQGLVATLVGGLLFAVDWYGVSEIGIIGRRVQQREQVAADIKSLADLATARVDDWLDERLGDVQVLAGMPVMGEDPVRNDDVTALLEQTVRAYDCYRAAYLVAAADGRVLSAYPFDGTTRLARSSLLARAIPITPSPTMASSTPESL